MMSRTTGKIVGELDHIKQSIHDILTTPIGERIARREYGSIIPDLIDQPINDVLILQLYSAIYTSISKWENRISIEKIAVSDLRSGALVIDLDAIYIPTDESLNLNIPLQMGAIS